MSHAQNQHLKSVLERGAGSLYIAPAHLAFGGDVGIGKHYQNLTAFIAHVLRYRWHVYPAVRCCTGCVRSSYAASDHTGHAASQGGTWNTSRLFTNLPRRYGPFITSFATSFWPD